MASFVSFLTQSVVFSFFVPRQRDKDGQGKDIFFLLPHHLSMVVLDDVLDGFCPISMIDGVLLGRERKAKRRKDDFLMAVILFPDQDEVILPA